MGRILSVDYGKKRCGLAVTDELKIIAQPLETIDTKDIDAYISAYVSRENVECIVVGLPLQNNNTPSESAQFIEPFVKRLKKNYPQIKIARMDERFTSKIAFDAMLEAGLKKQKRREKALVDTISATLILQSYMQKIEK